MFNLSPFVSAFVLFAKSLFSPRIKSELMTFSVFCFFSLLFCLLVICSLCIGQEVETQSKKRDIQHQEDKKVVLQICVTRRVTTLRLPDSGHIIIANTLETVPFPWLSENINSKKCTWKDKKEQDEPPMCNDNNNKYKCYEGIKSLKTLAKNPQVKKKENSFLN